MPLDNYISIKIGDQQLVYTDAEAIPLSIDYELENTNNFQEKGSATALEVVVPASPEMDRAANTFHNPQVADLTDSKVFRNPQPAVIEANGSELLIGKAILKEAEHSDKPENYKYDFYGDNGDWIIDLKETTLYDLLKHITFTYTKGIIEDSWAFDGTSEGLPYVFAPVRYGRPMGDYKIVNGERVPVNDNVVPTYLRPSISVYWLMVWGFESIGYQIDSNFIHSDFFKRLVMPWTFGNFLASEGTKYDIHKFRAKSAEEEYLLSGDGSGILDLDVTNDSTDGMFDNNNTVPNGDYTYDSVDSEMVWTYNTPHYGNLDVTFSNTLYVEATANQNSSVAVWVQWFKNGVFVSEERVLYVETDAGIGTRRSDAGLKTSFFTTAVSPGDTVSSKIRFNMFESKLGEAELKISVASFQIDYFRIPLGGTISFDAYLGLKKIKFLDFFRGIVDCFNLMPKARPEIKRVYIEPLHQVNSQPGYFNGNVIDWSALQDLSKRSRVWSYRDHDRELILRFKEDTNYGTLKVVQDRHQVILGSAKYVLPERFKQGKAEIENRFFSPVVHVDIDEWRSITGYAPQIVALIPENISNTSASEAENTFAPKLCYYKGMASFGWKWDNVQQTSWPYMFAVNYKSGGHLDPVLSYSDELIEGNIGMGLLRKYFLQRFANMREGVMYETWCKLNNNDVANPLHREFKILRGQKWEMVNISGYKPLAEQSTKVELRLHAPVVEEDRVNVFPSESSIVSQELQDEKFDVKYNQLKCLSSDIPRI